MEKKGKLSSNRLFLLIAVLMTFFVLSSIAISAEEKATTMASETGTIKGKLINAQTKKALNGVEVWALTVGKSADGKIKYTAVYDSPRATTDSEGQFSILNTPLGTYSLKVGMSFLSVDNTILQVVVDNNHLLIDLGEILVK